MNALIYTLGVVLFVLGVIVSIALHEVGHMYPAKKFGIKVTQYFVGFGNTLWSVKRGETEYGIKAIPLGGYVKLVGMLPPAADDDPHEVRATNTGLFTQLVADARHAEYEHVTDADLDRLFYRKPWWQKLIVMSGGPMVNVVIAVVLFSIVIMGFGVQEPTTTVSAVSDCAISDAEAGRACTDADPVTPARQAGLQPGDEFVSFNGTAITSWEQLTKLIRGNGDREATIVVERDGREVQAEVATSVIARASLDDPERTEKVGFLGVEPTQEYVRAGPRHRRRRHGRLHVGHHRRHRPPAAAHGRRHQGGVRRRAQARRARSASSGRAGSPASSSRSTSRPGPSAPRACWPCSPSSTCSWRCSTSSRCCRSTAATSPARSGRRSAAAGPACAARPTRATSTSPACSPSRTAWVRSCWSWA